MSCLSVQIHVSFLAIASSEAPLCSVSGWVCQWKHFWISVEDSFKKAYMEEWVFISDVPSEGPWEPAKPHDIACFWKRIEAPLPPLRPRPKCDFIHPRQLSPFPERLVLPFSNEVILSGYEELDSSGNDHFTSWARTERTRNPGRAHGGHCEGYSRVSRCI